MSFYEGSVWQQRQEEQEKRDRIRLDQLHKENPSLNWDDIGTLLKQEKEAVKPIVRCCVCLSHRREYVRVGTFLGPCTCICHQADIK